MVFDICILLIFRLKGVKTKNIKKRISSCVRGGDNCKSVADLKKLKLLSGFFIFKRGNRKKKQTQKTQTINKYK